MVMGAALDDCVEQPDLRGRGDDALLRALAENDLANGNLLEVQRIQTRAPSQLICCIKLQALALADDEQCDILVAGSQRGHEGRFVVRNLCDVWITAAGQQNLCCACLVFQHREVERRPARNILHVDIIATADEQAQAF
ncbi:probable dis1-suppressing kinase dsk1, putative [Babesia ovata]|uniref:Probable dis1-suppressing kinase dsk1, putative n=1 Tax=Babesia ovata TaxID=189622 RepID=A0A2H6K794_9APIC|nr:probable dis1-suppressing kinase dsk1, putative [Babesia ovata]GBE58876.1 probable dis1-suppressing kinase dsk1, putative [Babesia ovata]